MVVVAHQRVCIDPRTEPLGHFINQFDEVFVIRLSSKIARRSMPRAVTGYQPPGNVTP